MDLLLLVRQNCLYVYCQYKFTRRLRPFIWKYAIFRTVPFSDKHQIFHIRCRLFLYYKDVVRMLSSQILCQCFVMLPFYENSRKFILLKKKRLRQSFEKTRRFQFSTLKFIFYDISMFFIYPKMQRLSLTCYFPIA